LAAALYHLAAEPARHLEKKKSPRRKGAGIFASTNESFIFVFTLFARVFRVMFFAVVFARLAGMGDGLVTMPALTLARERGSTKWQRSQTKRNDDCPN
jgi:hypothetical protein